MTSPLEMQILLFLPLLTSIYVMLFWWVGDASYITLFSGMAPMQFNTALMVFLISVGALVAHKGRTHIAYAILGMAGVFVFFTLLQSVFRVNFHIDQLFFRVIDNLPHVQYPGRMSLPTAIGLFILTIGLILGIAKKYEIALILTLSVFVLTFASFVRYAAVLDIRPWSSLQGMSILTSLCLSLLSLSTLFLNWSAIRFEKIVISLSLLALAVNVVAWQALRGYEASQLNKLVALRLRATTQFLKRQLQLHQKNLETTTLSPRRLQSYMNLYKEIAFLVLRKGQETKILKAAQSHKKKEEILKKSMALKQSQYIDTAILALTAKNKKMNVVAAIDLPKILLQYSKNGADRSFELFFDFEKSSFKPEEAIAFLEWQSTKVPVLLRAKPKLAAEKITLIPEFFLLAGLLLTYFFNRALVLNHTLKIANEELSQVNENLNSEVNKRKVAEESLVKSFHNLTVVNKELEEFSYTVSHDLRAPLRHIAGFIKVLLKRTENKLSDEESSYMKRIEAAANKLGVMIDDLLSYARSARVPLQSEKIILNELIDEIFEQLSESYPSVQFQRGNLPNLVADNNLMFQLWSNLVGNAAKFSSQKPDPQVSVNFKGSDQTFSVRDNGIGFEPEYNDKIFRMFHQLSSEGEFTGTGIGLAVVAKVVQRYHGKIWAKAAPNKGAEFFFILKDVFEEFKNEKKIA